MDLFLCVRVVLSFTTCSQCVGALLLSQWWDRHWRCLGKGQGFIKLLYFVGGLSNVWSQTCSDSSQKNVVRVGSRWLERSLPTPWPPDCGTPILFDPALVRPRFSTPTFPRARWAEDLGESVSRRKSPEIPTAVYLGKSPRTQLRGKQSKNWDVFFPQKLAVRWNVR